MGDTCGSAWCVVFTFPMTLGTKEKGPSIPWQALGSAGAVPAVQNTRPHGCTAAASVKIKV